MKLLAQFASGPLAFLLLYWMPYEGVPPQGRLALAVFGWMVVWWMTQPVPWAITSILPLVLFPALGVSNINQSVARYGQNVFFWVWGTVMMGYAMGRHGLAKRFALWFVSLPLISGSTHRLAFGFMMATGLISMMVSDAATVAMMTPVGVSLVAFVRTVAGKSPREKSNFGAFLALGALYGAVAGGIGTIAGIPHNALSVALLEKFTGRAFGWFEWMKAGVPIFLVTLVAFYYILRLFFPPEMNRVPGGAEFLQSEKQKLGSWTAGERSTFFVFLAMVVLFTLPTAFNLLLGADHPVTKWGATGLSLYVVPPIVLLLLFSTPVNWSRGEFVLSWKEASENTPWNIMILITGAIAIVDALVEFGFIKFIGDLVAQSGLGPISLPFVSSFAVAIATNFMSGQAATTFFGSFLIPAAQQIGWNPASMAMLIPNVALGIAFPWAGAAAATAFATGEIEMKNMMRVGLVATLVFSILVAAAHILLAPIL